MVGRVTKYNVNGRIQFCIIHFLRDNKSSSSKNDFEVRSNTIILYTSINLINLRLRNHSLFQNVITLYYVKYIREHSI